MAIKRLSPKVNTTITPELHSLLQGAAKERGVSISQVLAEGLQLLLHGYLYQDDTETLITTNTECLTSQDFSLQQAVAIKAVVKANLKAA